MASKLQQKLQQQQEEFSDSDDSDQMNQYGGVSDDEPEEVATFYAKNLAANTTFEQDVGVNDMIEIKSIAISEYKAGDTTFYVTIADEKFTICTLNANCRQYLVKLAFQVTESPVTFGVTGPSGVTIVGLHRSIETDFDNEMIESDEDGIMEMDEGELGDDDDEEEEDEIKPVQKGKPQQIKPQQTNEKAQAQKQGAKQEAPKQEAKKEQPKQEAKPKQVEQPKKEQAKQPEQKKDTNQTPNKKGGNQNQNQNQNQPKTPNGAANGNGNKRPITPKSEGANKKQKFNKD